MNDIRVGHHMIVGYNIAVLGNKKARAQGFLFHLRPLAAAPFAAAELIKKFLKAGRHIAEHFPEEIFRAAP